jgi:hypothetical protein
MQRADHFDGIVGARPTTSRFVCFSCFVWKLGRARPPLALVLLGCVTGTLCAWCAPRARPKYVFVLRQLFCSRERRELISIPPLSQAEHASLRKVVKEMEQRWASATLHYEQSKGHELSTAKVSQLGSSVARTILGAEPSIPGVSARVPVTTVGSVLKEAAARVRDPNKPVPANLFDAAFPDGTTVLVEQLPEPRSVVPLGLVTATVRVLAEALIKAKLVSAADLPRVPEIDPAHLGNNEQKQTLLPRAVEAAAAQMPVTYSDDERRQAMLGALELVRQCYDDLLANGAVPPPTAALPAPIAVPSAVVVPPMPIAVPSAVVVPPVPIAVPSDVVVPPVPIADNEVLTPETLAMMFASGDAELQQIAAKNAQLDAESAALSESLGCSSVLKEADELSATLGCFGHKDADKLDSIPDAVVFGQWPATTASASALFTSAVPVIVGAEGLKALPWDVRVGELSGSSEAAAQLVALAKPPRYRRVFVVHVDGPVKVGHPSPLLDNLDLQPLDWIVEHEAPLTFFVAAPRVSVPGGKSPALSTAAFVALPVKKPMGYVVDDEDDDASSEQPDVLPAQEPRSRKAPRPVSYAEESSCSSDCDDGDDEQRPFVVPPTLKITLKLGAPAPSPTPEVPFVEFDEEGFIVDSSAPLPKSRRPSISANCDRCRAECTVLPNDDGYEALRARGVYICNACFDAVLCLNDGVDGRECNGELLVCERDHSHQMCLACAGLAEPPEGDWFCGPCSAAVAAEINEEGKRAPPPREESVAKKTKTVAAIASKAPSSKKTTTVAAIATKKRKTETAIKIPRDFNEGERLIGELLIGHVGQSIDTFPQRYTNKIQRLAQRMGLTATKGRRLVIASVTGDDEKKE